MNTHTYFEDIGLWPKHGGSIARVYVVGYILSLALTLGAYYLTPHYIGTPLLFVLLALTFAVGQFVVQIIAFLHLGREVAARGRSIALGFAVVIVTILVIGTLWIMHNLNQRMMLKTPQQMQQYVQSQEGI